MCIRDRAYYEMLLRTLSADEVERKVKIRRMMKEETSKRFDIGNEGARLRSASPAPRARTQRWETVAPPRAVLSAVTEGSAFAAIPMVGDEAGDLVLTENRDVPFGDVGDNDDVGWGFTEPPPRYNSIVERARLMPNVSLSGQSSSSASREIVLMPPPPPPERPADVVTFEVSANREAGGSGPTTEAPWTVVTHDRHPGRPERRRDPTRRDPRPREEVEQPVAQPWVQNDSNWWNSTCLLYTSPSPRDGLLSRMPSSA